jgi:hypothetical protein
VDVVIILHPFIWSLVSGLMPFLTADQKQQHVNFVHKKKKLSRETKQSILDITVIYYGDYMEMCEDVPQNFGNKTTGCCIMTMHFVTSFFTREFLTRNVTALTCPIWHPATFHCFPD